MPVPNPLQCHKRYRKRGHDHLLCYRYRVRYLHEVGFLSLRYRIRGGGAYPLRVLLLRAYIRALPLYAVYQGLRRALSHKAEALHGLVPYHILGTADTFEKLHSSVCGDHSNARIRMLLREQARDIQKEIKIIIKIHPLAYLR